MYTDFEDMVNDTFKEDAGTAAATTGNTTEQGANAGMANATAASDATQAATAPATQEAPVTSAPAESTSATTPPPAAPAPASQPAPINFEGISNGLIKSPEDITAFASKHRELETEVATLRAKTQENPYANDYVASLNQMYRDGKTSDQVQAFVKLHDLGEISQLSPVDAMVHAAVLRDGVDGDLAKRSLERQYGLTEGMDEDERKLIEFNMKRDARADYEYLTSQKKELASPSSNTVVSAAAVQAINIEDIKNQVAPIKTKVSENLNTLGNINLNNKVTADGKPAEDAIMFDLPIPAEFKAKAPQILEDFYTSNGLVPNADNNKLALDFLNYQLYNEHGVQLIQSAVSHAINNRDKYWADYYENKGGLPRSHGAPTANDADSQFDSFIQNEILGG